MSVLTAPRIHPQPSALESPKPPVRVQPLDERDYPVWDKFVAGADDGTLFHATSWLASVRDTFGHRPSYLAAWRGDRIVAGLPLFSVRSIFGGRMLVSVPCAVYGGAIGDDTEALRALQDAARALADRIGACVIELRSMQARWTGVPVVDRYVTYRRKLPNRPEDCLASLPRKARAAARVARDRHKLEVDFDDRHLYAVWRMYCDGMSRLASLNYPYRFFEELIDRTPGGHLVSMVSHRDRPVAGLVTFMFKGVAMPYFVGADERAKDLNVYNFIYLTAMERAVTEGCHTFDFGRSRRDNVGACDFKKNQGFSPQTLQYQAYSPAGRVRPDLTPTSPRFKLARRVWPLLPGAITRPLGAWLSRHIPG